MRPIGPNSFKNSEDAESKVRSDDLDNKIRKLLMLIQRADVRKKETKSGSNFLIGTRIWDDILAAIETLKQ